MLKYKVGLFYDNVIKDEIVYDNYVDAFNDYIDRVKQGFNVLGRIPKNLAIEYIEDGESVGKERLIISSDVVHTLS